MKRKSAYLLLLPLAFGLLQFIHPDIDSGTTKTKLLTDVPDNVENILRNSCYDCHSDQPDLKWFDKLTPVNFLVDSHIKAGRKVFDFTKFDSLNSDQRSAQLFYALNTALSGEMPLTSYTQLHRNAKLKAKDFEVIKKYLLSISKKPVAGGNQGNAKVTQSAAGNSQRMARSINGIEYISDYRQWKAISTSERFDNGTMRVIYGNDIAIKAIQRGETKNWPDGTVFAKAAWWQQTDKFGNIATGNFKQVEFMIKDSQKYRDTKGWGWARWLGDDLKPYGKTIMFSQECISCHTPMKENDYVFTAPLNLTVLSNQNSH